MTDDDTNGMGGVESSFDTGLESLDEDLEPPDNTLPGGESTLKERRESVKDERPETLTVYLREGTKTDITMLKAEAQRTFPGETISDLDLYEAIFRAGLTNPEGVMDELRAIGYGKHQ